MFRSAATKIAHNSNFSSLAGNKDLKPLQDLITAEKSILQSLQKLSLDFAKASDCLRIWGQAEGDDLSDTLNASFNLLTHWSSALGQFYAHEEAVRTHMKAVRTREEALGQLKSQRRSVGSKADAAEKKLNKMSPEHKSLPAQSELLIALQDEMRRMDQEIMVEEARLGDFKRESTKLWMTLKFGGMSECCEKGSIVGEMGKFVIAEIQKDTTTPGLPRPYYQGHQKCQLFVDEASRAVNEVQFSSSPSDSPGRSKFQPPHYQEVTADSEDPYTSSPRSPRSPRDLTQSPSSHRNGHYLNGPNSVDTGLGLGNFMDEESVPRTPAKDAVDEFGTVTSSGFSAVNGGAPYSSQSLPMTSGTGSSFRNDDMSTVSASTQRTSQPPSPVVETQPSKPSVASRIANAGSRFATFPVKRNGRSDSNASQTASLERPSASGLRGPSPAGARVPPPAIETAPTSSMNGTPRVPIPALDGLPAGSTSAFAPSLDLNKEEQSDFMSSITLALGNDFNDAQPGSNGGGYAPPAGAPPSQLGSRFSMSPQASPVASLPPGAAPPTIAGRPSSPPAATASSFSHPPSTGSAFAPPPGPPPGYPSADNGMYHTTTPSTSSQPAPIAEEDSEDTQLAYMSDPEEMLAPSDGRRGSESSVDRPISRHVKFGSVSDMEEEMEKRSMDQNRDELNIDVGAAEDATSPVERTPRQFTRPPTPPPPHEEQQPPPRDEKSRNAAAARDVTKELDALLAQAHSPLSPTFGPEASMTGPPSSRGPSPPTSGMRGPPAPAPSYSGLPSSPVPVQDDAPSPRVPAPAPPSISLPRPSFNSAVSGASAYGTPPEYPSRNPSNTSLPLPKSVPPPPASPGGGKISAAAFRQQRQQRMPSSGGPADTTPLSFKKRPLPSSPYPQRNASPNPGAPSLSQLASDDAPLPLPGRVKEERPISTATTESEFDYISAYMGDGASEGNRNSGYAEFPGRRSGDGGYGQGRYATNLDDSGLR